MKFTWKKSYITLALHFFTILSNFWIYRVSSLNTQGIVAGFPVFLGLFCPYQVAISGRSNGSNINYLMCNGGIISYRFVLSAAQCFFDERGVLKQLRFTVIYCTNNLKTFRRTRDVDIIYTYEWENNWLVNDIAVLKITSIIDVAAFIRILKLPYQDESFAHQIGRVSGYGFTWIKTVNSTVLGVRESVSGGTDFRLKFIPARIATGTQCKQHYPDIDVFRQICGVAVFDGQVERRGICNNDTGAPLVFDDVIVGIASRHRPDCNDQIYGSVYTKISPHVHFIKSIMALSPLHGTVSYRNRNHHLVYE